MNCPATSRSTGHSGSRPTRSARSATGPRGNDIAIIYAGGGRPIPQPGLVRLGTVDGGLDVIAAAGDEFEMTVERCD